MMEEEPESARPEEGKSQDGEYQPSPPTEMAWSQCSQGFVCCIAGGEGKTGPRVEKSSSRQGGGDGCPPRGRSHSPLFPIQGNNAERDKKAEKKTPDDKVSPVYL